MAIVDQSGQIVGGFTVGDGMVPEYVGQTFTAAGTLLDSITFFLKVSSGSALGYRILVTTASFDEFGFHPGDVLFESGLLTEAVGGDYRDVSVNTAHLKLTPGQTYAFLIDAF